MCKALGDPTRAQIFQYLHSCCSIAVSEAGEVRPSSGPTVGEVCCTILGTDKATSTMSFHLKELREAGLIVMEKRGKHVVCSLQRETLAKLTRYFDEINQPCGCSAQGTCNGK
ncbi:MAG: helix-turn-helix transcriptional regulator [Chthonomonas sp.]|nr:helix-turn-helix transcriptional regulator [Chthonomonas sp.]